MIRWLRWFIPFLICLPLVAQNPVHYYSNSASSATAVSVAITIPSGCPTAPAGCAVAVFFGAPLYGTSPIVSITGTGPCPATFPIQTPATAYEQWWSYALNLSAGNCTITASITNSAFTGSLTIQAEVVTGLNAFAAYETQNYQGANSVTSLTNSFITQTTNEYIVASAFLDGCGSGITSGSSYNVRGFVATPGAGGGLGLMDFNAASAGVQSNQVNFGCTVNHANQILIAFRTTLPTSGLRQVTHLISASTTSLSGSLPAPVLAGSVIGVEVTASSPVAIGPISDDVSDNCAFPPGPTVWFFSNNARATFLCLNVTAGTRTITIPFSGATGTDAFLYEMAGASTTQPVWMGLEGDSGRGVRSNIQVYSAPLPPGSYTLVGAIYDLSCTSQGGNFYNPPQSGYTDFFDTPIGFGSGCANSLKSLVSENITNPGTMSYSATPGGGTADVSANMSLIAFSSATNTSPRPTDMMEAPGPTPYPVQAGDNRILCLSVTPGTGGYTNSPTSTIASTCWTPIDGFTTITSWNIGSAGANIATFQGANHFIAGGQTTLQSFGTSTFFNGVSVTVLAAGLTSAQFEVSFTHANGSATEAGQAISPIACWSNRYTAGGYDTVGLTGLGADNPNISFGYRGYTSAIITNWQTCGASVTSCMDGGITTTVPGSFVQSIGLLTTTRTSQPVSSASGFTQNTSIFGHTEAFGSSFQINAAVAAYQGNWTFTSAQGMDAAIFAFAPPAAGFKQPAVVIISENADPTQAWRKELVQ